MALIIFNGVINNINVLRTNFGSRVNFFYTRVFHLEVESKLSPWKFKQLIKNRIFSLLMFVINLDILMRTPGSSIPRMSNDLLIITC